MACAVRQSTERAANKPCLLCPLRSFAASAFASFITHPSSLVRRSPLPTLHCCTFPPLYIIYISCQMLSLDVARLSSQVVAPQGLATLDICSQFRAYLRVVGLCENSASPCWSRSWRFLPFSASRGPEYARWAKIRIGFPALVGELPPVLGASASSTLDFRVGRRWRRHFSSIIPGGNGTARASGTQILCLDDALVTKRNKSASSILILIGRVRINCGLIVRGVLVSFADRL